jgi:hypothetical protein
MTGGEKAALILAAGGIAVLAFKGDASAATAPGGGSAGLAGAPIIVPEANLPQAAINWYDLALTQLGFAGTFSDRLMGFQRTRMQGVLAPELSRLTPATQQAIQSAVGPTVATGDLGGSVPAGCYRSRY